MKSRTRLGLAITCTKFGGDMRLFGLKNCDSCRAALGALRDAGYAVEFVDVRADGVPTAELKRFVKAFGDRLVNRRSTTWRGLSEAERSGDPMALIRAHPTLMKRPVIDTGQALCLGWDRQVQEKILGSSGASA